jgi:hypothetical protein
MSTQVQEFLVLGSQRLCALRDSLYCLADFVLTKHPPNADHPRLPSNSAAASAFFFFQNVFYNDLRCVASMDLVPRAVVPVLVVVVIVVVVVVVVVVEVVVRIVVRLVVVVVVVVLVLVLDC